MDGIAYQNKDIMAKYLAEYFRDKSLSVYGIDVPKIIEVLPTNLPTVEANELRIDNLFRLEDGSYAIVDYESTNREADRLKYLGYLYRVLKRYERDGIYRPRLRMIVIYTADIEETDVEFQAGCLFMKIEAAFLSKLDSERIKKRLLDKIEKREAFSDDELMELVILPLTYRGKESQEKAVMESVEMVKGIEDEGTQIFALSGILTFTDKIINIHDAEQIRRRIQMTKVAQIFEAEKQAAVAVERAKVEIERTKVEAERKMVAKNLLARGLSPEELMMAMPMLNLLTLREFQKEVEMEK